ncbi:MAG: hypothetical protein KOO66_12200 [Bacteroidales bacterium]|nr:hypothetical protein [Bacteroidales bacterium]
MKKIIIVLIALFIGFSANAQKFKAKKGILTKDKIEIGKVEGSLWKMGNDGATVFGLNNEIILKIKLNEHNFDNPLYKTLKWYEFSFGPDKDFIFNHLNSAITSVPQILKVLTKKYGFEFDGSIIENQDELIAKYNYKAELEQGIKAKNLADSKYAKILGDNEIQRNRLMPIKYKTLKKEELVLEQLILQDTIRKDANIIIGSFKREYKRDLGSTVNKEVEYWFMERFSQPQGDDKLKEYYAAGVIIDNPFYAKDCEVYTFVDKKTHEVKIKDPLKAEKTIIKFLLNNGYL